jgi:predicted nucleic acid-binding protein
MTEEVPKFLLDANVLIAAHRSYYAFDICPGFWEAVKTGHAAARIFSTQRVLAELRRGGDALLDWVEAELPEGFFLDDSAASVISEYAPMMQWVQSRDFHTSAKTKFASDADGWLVAMAKHAGYTLVTHEVRRDAKAKVPMPNVCDQFGVNYCDTYEMLRALACSFR